MSFPENLQRLRKANKLSQDKLAEILNISRQAVAKWECGQSYPDINKLITLRQLFNTSIDELINGEEIDLCERRGKTNLNDSLIDVSNIIDFLLRAKKATYAGKGAEIISCRPNSHDLEYIEGDLKYLDTYLGGGNFAGEEALWKKNVPFWAMNYVGRVLEEGFSGNFLREALSLVNQEHPYRGPLEYKRGEYKYRCSINGDFLWFQGNEEIYKNNLKVYECIFHGGIIE